MLMGGHRVQPDAMQCIGVVFPPVGVFLHRVCFIPPHLSLKSHSSSKTHFFAIFIFCFSPHLPPSPSERRGSNPKCRKTHFS